MTFTVLAGQGLDVAKLGEHRDELRARLGAYESFQRTPDAPVTDHFDHLDLMLTYDDTGRLELIEVASPADVVFSSVPLLGRSCPDVVEELAEQGIVGVEHDSLVEFREQGFCLFSEDLHDEDVELDGVGVFAPGYYDR
ncbi:hypothetical protein SAMN05421504_101407 [Amycolatopsis xylanica]|uniref:Uncharacterized protein n=1 Tax=Amycolatopsis xylanica TaxID=589385 RepID=A0A1H2SZU2_9PSEU|nr:hypothetical protein [Amycolatopsis xylanica]SDW37047.1 hypothetical protein SAMN05421504_101407 [Amycolatopsis xylanica]